MKVVLFCGGFGMRLREFSESIPKPMVNIGYRPILWHIMKYYAHFGHKDFILCLGWQGNVIKEYFLNYNECMSNDFVLSAGGAQIELLDSDIHDWNITFVDTGMSANIGERLKAVEPYLEGEEAFLANYSDGLSDLDLHDLVRSFEARDAIASFVSVRPPQSFHAVGATSEGVVRQIRPIEESDIWMNGGYFVLRPEVFDFIRKGEELVEEPFHRLISREKLSTLKYEGFWGCMDTFKEMQMLDELWSRGEAPWQVWRPCESLRRPRNATGKGLEQRPS